MKRWLVVALAAGLAVAGCGVPERTDVVVDGRGQATGVQDRAGGEQVPPGPEGIGNNVEEFVNRFLEAPAGDWEGAGERVKEFLSPEQRDTWKVPREVTVVRLVNGKPEIKPGPTSEVVLDVQQLGVLTEQGTLEPPTARTRRYTFTVGPVSERPGGLAVLNPPRVMLLTDTALGIWYDQRPLYFWDTDHRNLVPDLRYLPKAVEQDARPNVLLGWLLGGPADWLRPSVLGLPEGTKQLRNPYKDDGRLMVNLSDAATNENLDQLVAQLVWSLRNDFTGELVLKIEHVAQREATTSDHLAHNPAYRLADRGPELFAVAGAAVRRVQLDTGAQVPPDVPLLSPDVNRNVRSAAISGDNAALVRDDGGKRRLWVGPPFRKTGLAATTMSRPVLAGSENVGYVAADGRLYQFTVDKPAVVEVSPSGLAGPVTAVALASDGQRLAVVAGGRPYLVALGGNDGSASAARALPAPLGGLTGISWPSETSLVMSGVSGDRAALARVTVDGAIQTETVQELSTPPVTQLVAFPENPFTRLAGPIMIEADSGTYQVFTSSLQPQNVVPPAKTAPVAPFFRE